MMHKTKEAPTESEVREECRHYWIIAEASGPTSRGVCKFCGTKREFRNSWDSSYVGRDTGIFGLPNLLEDGSDKEPEDSELEESNANP
jgi:hypothetical protein